MTSDVPLCGGLLLVHDTDSQSISGHYPGGKAPIKNIPMLLADLLSDI
jgi:hypothetical protein